MFNTAKEVISVFREIILCYTGSQDHSLALKQIFGLLRRHFPLDGLCFHQFDLQRRDVKLLFCVTEHDLYYIEKTMPLPEEEVALMYAEEGSPCRIVAVGHSLSGERFLRYSKMVSHLLPLRDRALLLGNLSMWGRLIGRMVFLGTGPDVFTPTQIEQIEPLLGPFSVLLTSMLKLSRDEAPSLVPFLSDKEDMVSRGLFPYPGARHGLKNILEVVGHLEGQDIPVLIRGETGTGQELFADAVQRVSPRYNAPFVKMNCGAVPDTLLDSETFGFEKGAFTGATKAHQGKFEQADRGTLFLDEVGDLSPQAQVRLLRILQDGIVQRIGSYRPIPVNVRIIAATNRPLEEMVSTGLFREDLYYRLNVFPLLLPPLRERREDIPELVRYFMRRESKRLRLAHVPRLGPSTLAELSEYPWPGNVRELENLVMRAMVVRRAEPLLLESFLPPPRARLFVSSVPLRKGDGMPCAFASVPGGCCGRREAPEEDISVKGECPAGERESGNAHPVSGLLSKDRRGPVPCSLDDAQRAHILDALCYCNGKVSGPGGVAQLLGINPATLRKKMQRVGIEHHAAVRSSPAGG